MNSKLQHFLHTRRPTLKLAATYLVVIMVMSSSFSLILYFTSIHSFERRSNMPPPVLQQRDPDHEIDEWLGRRAADNRNDLAVRLTILNGATLLVGACISYYLARRSLRPIEKAMQEQERFIADASHELRTPLTALLLSNEVTLRKKELTIADARQILKQNVADINELKVLSDELLDVSADSNLPVVNHDVRLQSVAKQSLKQVKAMASAKHISIELAQTDIRISTDELMLSKVIIILLDNAIKYSPKGSHVRVSFKADRRRAGIVITDEGMGIAPEDIDHIFERLYRADVSRTQTAGHGLGLSIATKLVAKLGGEIQVESTPGQGSTFIIWLLL